MAETRWLDRLLPPWHRPGNGNGTKAGDVTGVSLLDHRTTEPGMHFFSPDGTRTIYRLLNGASSEAERVEVATAYVAASYAYVAMRWRADRLREAPLMVVAEDQEDGTDEWLPKHPLAVLLDQPSPDFDMAELLFRTSIGIDQDGHALWTKVTDGRGRPGRLQLFRGSEFEIESTSDLLRGMFVVRTARGEKRFTPEQVVYFHEPDPDDWTRGLSRLGVALSWLNLGQAARATVRDLLRNSVWPSIVLQPDAEWNPDDKEFQRFKDEVDGYAQPGRKGRALTVLGGGNATVVSSRIRDLVPGDLFNRVESTIASVFGVPAIVLQYEVGLQNSPWSQMEQARRMAYEDTAEPRWKEIGTALTRQLLRPVDPSPVHFIRFDVSRIRALQKDRAGLTAIAGQWADIASINERRTLVGLEPSDDPEADKMPWVAAAERREQMERQLAGLNGDKPDDDDDTDPGDDPDPEEEEEEEEDAEKAAQRRQVKRDLFGALRADQIREAEFGWEVLARRRLEADRAEIVRLAELHLGEGKADGPSPAAKKRFFRSVASYLKGKGGKAWTEGAGPLAKAHAERAAAAVVADVGFRFDLVRPGIAKFAEEEVGFLVRSITATTRDAVERAVASGLESGASIADIAANLRDLPAFDRDRAKLVARTESARVMNGAPTAMLQEREAATGRRFVKVWSTALDDRVRDEHAAMEGEQVPVKAKFSNGLDYPSEPNCRCVVTFEEVGG